jgi:hypothetical protein
MRMLPFGSALPHALIPAIMRAARYSISLVTLILAWYTECRPLHCDLPTDSGDLGSEFMLITTMSVGIRVLG